MNPYYKTFRCDDQLILLYLFDILLYFSDVYVSIKNLMQSTKPKWLKIRAPQANSAQMQRFTHLRKRVKERKLHTVCEEAHCPNMAECWGEGTATFMVMGDTCTRACKFCNVKTGFPNKEIDPFEPLSLGKAIKEMDLNYAVITSVDRDDLQDEGAGHFAQCIRAIEHHSPQTIVEVLIPDFRGKTEHIDTIIQAKPRVIAQNIETVKRLTKKVRDMRAGYEQTLNILKYIKETSPETYTKSSIIVGLGETEQEVIETMQDLRDNKVDFLTIGQYLQPSEKHFPLAEYVTPKQFKKYETIGLEMGFLYAFSGPMVRSSYKAGEYFFLKNIEKQNI